jgi:hypothetical protein
MRIRILALQDEIEMLQDKTARNEDEQKRKEALITRLNAEIQSLRLAMVKLGGTPPPLRAPKPPKNPGLQYEQQPGTDETTPAMPENRRSGNNPGLGTRKRRSAP